MEIAQQELGLLCTHLVMRTLYAFNIKKSVKELNDIIAICDSYGTMQDSSQTTTEGDISVRPEPMVKVREIAVSKRDLLKDSFRRKKEIQKGIEDKNLSVLMNYVRDKSFDDALPLTAEAEKMVEEMQAKTKFENEIYAIIHQEAERFSRQHPHYDVEEIFTSQDQDRLRMYTAIIAEEKNNKGKNCGPMAYLLKTFYETIKLVEDEVKNGHFENARKELLTKQVVWRRIAQTTSDDDDKEMWKVKLEADEDEDFFFDDDTALGDDDLSDEEGSPSLKKANSSGALGGKPLLSNLFSNLLTKAKAKQSSDNLNLGFLALMSFALYTNDQMIRKDDDNDLLVSKLSKDQFNAIYRVARFIIVLGLKHVKKNAIVQEKLATAVVDQLTNSIEYILSAANKYLPREETARIRKIIYAINDKNDARFESLLNKAELALWKDKKQSGQGQASFKSLLQVINEPAKIEDKVVPKTVAPPVKAPEPVAEVVREQTQPADSSEDDDEEYSTDGTEDVISEGSKEEEEDGEMEIVVNYNIFGIDKVDYPNLCDPSNFVAIFVEQVKKFVAYINESKKSKPVEIVCDEDRNDNLTSAFMRKAVLPAFRALFIGPEEDPADLFFNGEAYHFNYLLDIARSGTQNSAIPIIVEGILKAQKEITIQDLWLEDPDHFKTARFNAFWCNCLNNKSALTVFDEICSPGHYSNFFKHKPRFIHPSVRSALESLASLPLKLNCGPSLSQYDPALLEQAE